MTYYLSMFKSDEWYYMVGECPTLINPAQPLQTEDGQLPYSSEVER